MKPLLYLAVLIAGSASAGYPLQSLEKAHGMFHASTNAMMYGQAARQYEFLVKEEGIRNGDLFYTLGNSWFLADDIGRAVLNYRRAERYLPNHADVRHNLEAALERRIDLIPEQPPLADKILGWILKTSAPFRWRLFVACWLAMWGLWIWTGRTKKREARRAMALAGGLAVLLMASLLTEALAGQRMEPGVIVAKEIGARKGNGERYALAFLDPLHSGTEFQRMESRGGWWLIRLADTQTCWIPSHAAEMVSFSD